MSEKNSGSLTSKKSLFEIDMCSGSIVGKMLLFAVPLIFSSVLQLLFNAADVVIVGKFAGDNALAAVGSTGALINLLVNVVMGLSVGTNVLVARHFAAKEEEEVSKAVHTSMVISLIGGVFLTIIGLIFAPKILVLMDTPEGEVRDLATLYLRIYFLGIIASVVYNFGSAVLRAIGDTVRPLIFLFISGVVNVGLNLFFVVKLDMSVDGVAIATVVSQCISAVCVVVVLLTEKSSVRLEFKKLKISKDKLIQILKIGLPAGIQGSLFSLSNVALQSSVNYFGETVIAGNSAAGNLEGFVYVSMNAFHQAAISFVGQNVGAGQYKRVNKVLYSALGCVTAVGLVLGLGLWMFGEPLLSLYTGNPEVIKAGMVRLSMISTVYFLCGIMDVMVGALRGLGKSVMPMIVSLIGACGFRLLWVATVFQLPQFKHIETVYISYAISWIITAATHMVCYIVTRKKLRQVWGT
jgi:putative MATE family efflux protein